MLFNSGNFGSSGDLGNSLKLPQCASVTRFSPENEAGSNKKARIAFIRAEINRRENAQGRDYGLAKSNLTTTVDSSAAGSYFHLLTAETTA